MVYIAATIAAAAHLNIPPAFASSLPSHTAQFEAESGLCRVDFTPDASTGPSPPTLSVSVSMLSGSLQVYLSGGQFLDSVFLWGDNRLEMPKARSISVAELNETDLWKGITEAAQKGLPMFWTVRNAEGDYSSARYDALGPIPIGRTLALICDISGFSHTAPTEIEAQRAERRLNLTEAQIHHIRRILFNRYGEPGAQPGSEPEFTVTDRRLIGTHNLADGSSPMPFLTDEIAEGLLAESIPLEMPDAVQEVDGAASFGDWSLLVESESGSCSVYSPVLSSEGYSGSVAPIMMFRVSRADSGGLMAIELTTPNVFSSTEPIKAVIGDASIALTVERTSGAVVPRPLADGRISNEIMRSIRRAERVAIDGTSQETGSPIRLLYSAMGFTTAFREMARQCNRPGILGWLE